MYGFFRPTEEVFNAWESTRRICEALDSRIVVFQCPASFNPTDEHIENMHEFFATINRRMKANELELVWEPRGSWKQETIKEPCETLHLSHCTDPFAAETVHTESIAYFRLHGTPPGKKMYYY